MDPDASGSDLTGKLCHASAKIYLAFIPLMHRNSASASAQHRRYFEAEYLHLLSWMANVEALSGRLDTVLRRSHHLREEVLKALVKLAGTLAQGLPDNFYSMRMDGLSAETTALKNLIQQASLAIGDMSGAEGEQYATLERVIMVISANIEALDGLSAQIRVELLGREPVQTTPDVQESDTVSEVPDVRRNDTDKNLADVGNLLTPIRPTQRQPERQVLGSADTGNDRPRELSVFPSGQRNGSPLRKNYEDTCLERSSPYRYRTLNKDRKEIRLLQVVNRGTFEDELFRPEGLRRSEADPEFRIDNERLLVVKLSVVHFPLDSCPPFLALSYTWGDPTHKRPVFVPVDPRDLEGGRYEMLAVTENLFQALRQTRPLKGVPYIWADAICINQQDEVEKSWQVAQMWDTYKAANHVGIWLGSGGAVTNELMDSLSRTANAEVNRIIGTGGQGDPQDLRIPDDFEMLTEFRELTENPYWTRAWIRQEISAKDPDEIIIWYGRRMIQYQVLSYFLNGLQNCARLAGQVAESRRTPFQRIVLRLASSRSLRAVSDSLESAVTGKARIVHILITWLRKIYLWGDGLQATDPRDLIFSLVSMTNWRDQDGPPLYPDYTKSCREVYIKMTKSWLHLITWRNDPEDNVSNDLNLPSWVPDWRRRIRPVHYLALPPFEGNSEHSYKAGNMLDYQGGYTIKTKRDPSANTANPCFLYLEGFIVDTVQSLSPVLERSGDGEDAHQTCRKWIQHLETLTKADVTTRFERLKVSSTLAQYATASQIGRWKVPIMNLGIENGSIATAPVSYGRAFATVAGPNLSASALASIQVPPRFTRADGEDEATVLSRYVDIMLSACERRKFFATKAGLLGLAFTNVQEGDLVVVFPGLGVPLVLRKIESTGYKIISDAYLQGVMDAETKDDVGTEFSLEEFAII